MTEPEEPADEEHDATTGTAPSSPGERVESPTRSVETFDKMLLATRAFYRRSPKK